jgi:hypothetical protein
MSDRYTPYRESAAERNGYLAYLSNLPSNFFRCINKLIKTKKKKTFFVEIFPVAGYLFKKIRINLILFVLILL